MIANYGYKDGSGDFFIAIDSDKCSGCGNCIEVCPAKALELRPDDNDPFRDEPVVVVVEEHRKKIKYTCAPCKPVSGNTPPPCIASCEPGAITQSW